MAKEFVKPEMMKGSSSGFGSGRGWHIMLTLGLMLAIAGCEGGEKSPAADGARRAAIRPPAAETGLLAMFRDGEPVPPLEDADRRQLRAAEPRAYFAAEGKPVHWQNPQSGTFGELVPVGRALERGGQVCREFRHVVLVAGRVHQATGTACGRLDRRQSSRNDADTGEQG